LQLSQGFQHKGRTETLANGRQQLIDKAGISTFVTIKVPIDWPDMFDNTEYIAENLEFTMCCEMSV